MQRPGSLIAEMPRAAGDPLGGCADPTRMRHVLGWEPSITVENGVRRHLERLDRTPQTIPEWLRGEAGRTLGLPA